MDDKSLAEIRAEHLEKAPVGCGCAWCVEGQPDSPQTSIFDLEVDDDE